MKYQPATKSLILDAEKIARSLRVISGRTPEIPAGWDSRTEQNRLLNFPNWVSGTLLSLYRAIKHLIPSPRAPYWNQVNRAAGAWNAAYGRKNWVEISVAYDRVLEAVYAAEDQEADE